MFLLVLGGVKMKSSKKRLNITISQEVYDKVEESALRYGITANSFISFIIGQWVDTNADLTNKISEKVDSLIPDLDSVFENQQLVDLLKEMIKSDEVFKNAVKNNEHI